MSIYNQGLTYAHFCRRGLQRSLIYRLRCCIDRPPVEVYLQAGLGSRWKRQSVADLRIGQPNDDVEDLRFCPSSSLYIIGNQTVFMYHVFLAVQRTWTDAAMQSC